MMGTIGFYEEALSGGVKPILGTEIYVAPGSRTERKVAPTGEYAYHLILLAENETGYRNLLRLSSLAHTEGFYYRPRVDKELLRRYSEGLIATSACLQGEVPFAIGTEGEAKALEVLEEYKSIFTDGRFYIEIQATTSIPGTTSSRRSSSACRRGRRSRTRPGCGSVRTSST
jgi:DNA polymerase-3 subunit alpha